MRTLYDPETKATTLELLKSGMAVKEIATKMEVGEQTIRNWKTDLLKKNGNGGGNGGAGGTPKKRRRKKTIPQKSDSSVRQELKNVEFTLQLNAVENQALRAMMDVQEREKRAQIEILYLRKRLGLFDDEWVKALTIVPEEIVRLFENAWPHEKANEPQEEGNSIEDDDT